MSRLQEIVKGLKHLTAQEVITISNDCLFENAIKLYISENIDKSKKENIRDIQNHSNDKKVAYNQDTKGFDRETKPNNEKVKLASDKQKSTMKKFHIPFTDKTTISEAIKLIDTKFKEIGIKES